MQNATQEEIYSKVCNKAVSHVLQGFNSCIIATGQTSAGKSYTIVGDEALTYKTRGMIARSIEEIFKQTESSPGLVFDIKFSVLEVMNEKIIDLLQTQSSKPIEAPQIMEQNGKQMIKNLAAIQLHNVSEGLELLFGAEACRTVGQTALNSQSSRSHVIYIVDVRQSSRTDEGAAGSQSRLYLVDLAGSEKQGQDSASAFINKSLSALELCISGLARSEVHIPFRQSKLTHVLKDCLGGSSKTALVACVRPDDEYLLETIQTLRFAQRAVNITTEASVNVINRMFEAGGDQRKTNQQVTQAVAEALESQGALGQLQARVLRELEAENRKLKTEILLVTGQEARFEAQEQEALRKAADAWVADAGKLPELSARADFVFILEHLKKRLQHGQNLSLSNRVGSPPPILPQIPIGKDGAVQLSQGSQNAQRIKSGAKQLENQLTKTFGAMQDSGALSIAVSGTFQMANSLMPGKSRPISEAQGSPQIGAQDEHAKFNAFRKTVDGVALATELSEVRATTKRFRDEGRQIQNEIGKIAAELNTIKKQLAEKAEVYKKNGGENSDQNILNYSQNQYQVKLANEMNSLALQAQQKAEKMGGLQTKLEAVKQQIDLNKVEEEHCRKKLLSSFETFCAGLNKKSNEIMKNEVEEKENLMYSTILERTKQRK